MAARGRGRRGARDGAQQDEPTMDELVNLHRLNELWHIAGAFNAQREQVFLPRLCVFLMPPSAPLIPFIRQARFEHAVQLRDFSFVGALLSAFVESWRLETHSFHLPWGECTITL
ncbi:hypothetical protein PIB30_089711 [Stylosanthes scabra]|uniref:Aminotransferase-like plant mobile domain-containing protein n=1 Tax=Stylosanthes scabra TaxID=79078 RepID=A0ABU6YSV2_9FABA|nr:hypothetical protein [Stylosanthes scabra]